MDVPKSSTLKPSVLVAEHRAQDRERALWREFKTTLTLQQYMRKLFCQRENGREPGETDPAPGDEGDSETDERQSAWDSPGPEPAQVVPEVNTAPSGTGLSSPAGCAQPSTRIASRSRRSSIPPPPGGDPPQTGPRDVPERL